MLDRIDQIRSLINRFRLGHLTPEEDLMLQQWLTENEENHKLFNTLTDDNLIENEMRLHASYESPHLWDVISQQMDGNKPVRVISPPTRSREWKMYVTAASILTLIVLGIIWFIKQPTTRPQVTTTPVKSADTTKPIAPNKGNIILTDNSTLYLAKDGYLVHQSSFVIHKILDTVAYEKDAALTDTGTWNNTFNAPRGSRYTVKLPNGIKTQLTPNSVIRFLVSDNKLQIIDVKGEVGVKVSPGHTPFIVNIYRPNDQYLGKLEVTGTTFNIDASDANGDGKITLLEGKLKVFPAIATSDEKQGRTFNHFSVLKPGQQAQLGNGKINIIDGVDTDAVVAWQKGKLEFDEVPIKKVLSKLENWYNFEIDYSKSIIPDCQMTIIIRPNMTLSTILAGLKAWCPQLDLKLKSK